MSFWVILFIVIIILGALSGGESFGDTVATGIGCVLILAAVGIVLLLFLMLIG